VELQPKRSQHVTWPPTHLKDYECIELEAWFIFCTATDCDGPWFARALDELAAFCLTQLNSMYAAFRYNLRGLPTRQNPPMFIVDRPFQLAYLQLIHGYVPALWSLIRLGDR